MEKTNSEKPQYTSVRTSALCCPEADSLWYRAVIQNSPEGFLLLKHPGGDILDTNDVFCQMMGYNRDELLLMNIKDVVIDFIESPEKISPPEINTKIEKTSHFEVRYRKKSGEIIDLEVSQKHIVFDSGFTLCFYRDITEEKELYHRLKESEEKFRLVTDNVADVIFTMNLDGSYTYISPSITNLRGYSIEEIMSQRNEDRLTPNSIEKRMNVLSEALIENEKRGTPTPVIRNFELEMYCKNGSTVWTEVKTDFILDKEGKASGIVGVYRDISARKKAERTLRESEERYKALVETAGKAGEGIIVIQDTEAHEAAIIFMSTQLIKKLGYRKTEIIGAPVNILFSDKYKDSLRELYISRHKGKKVLSNYEIDIICKDGKSLPVEIAAGITVYNGKIATVVYVRDITNRKKAEERLKSLISKEKRLSHRLEEEIKQRLDFTRTLVHELKTPLTAIINSSELLKGELKNRFLSKVAKNIYTSAYTLDSRINELLDLARSEIGTLSIEPKALNPGSLILEVKREISILAEAEGQSIITEVPESLPPIWGDSNRIKQVLFNLIGNALKYNRSNSKVILSAKMKGRYLLFEVQDEGSGIADEDLERIFQPYYRSENERGMFNGLGLGLPLSKSLVELHQGQLWAKNGKKAGSTFSFTIPLASPVKPDKGASR